MIVKDVVCEKTAGYMGIIRLQNISPITKSLAQGHQDNSSTSQQVYDAFRPGDIIRARILALAESNLYYLSTEDSHLGVIVARSAASAQKMTPSATDTMVCPVTQQPEKRKVALNKE